MAVTLLPLTGALLTLAAGAWASDVPRPIAQDGAAGQASAGHNCGPHQSQVQRTETISLGPDFANLTVIFVRARSGLPQVYLARRGQACRAERLGVFTRGSLIAGRGGRGNRYRLIGQDEVAQDVVALDGRLVIVRAGQVVRRLNLR